MLKLLLLLSLGCIIAMVAPSIDLSSAQKIFLTPAFSKHQDRGIENTLRSTTVERSPD